MPSTYRSATLGGLFGGGFGGVGSINYGPLARRGNVLGVRAMTIEAEPQIVELRGAEALRMHHLWGTNGLVLELEVALAPAHPWLESLVVFDDFDARAGLRRRAGARARHREARGGLLRRPGARLPGAAGRVPARGLPCGAVAGGRVVRRPRCCELVAAHGGR